jgi:outer membrane beta-barrel protein
MEDDSMTSREIGVSVFLTAAGLGWLGLVACAWAGQPELPDFEGGSRESAHRAKSEDGEYDFNWLDPEKKIYVLQNRKFLKSGHALLSVMGGIGFSNPYRSSYNVDPRFTFYISESFGIELFYTYTGNYENSTFRALTVASGSSALPQIREVRSQFGGAIQYVPWYAKINVFNVILHFDWYFNGGVGDVQTFVDTRVNVSSPSRFVQQDLMGLFISTGQLFHITQSFDVRLDVTGSYYQAPINGLTGETSWYSNYNFGIGAGLKL